MRFQTFTSLRISSVSRVPIVGILGLLALAAHAASAIESDEREFFETKIRPILAQSCYECHRENGKTKGGLALDYREGILKGGDSGPAMDLENPDQSLLLQAIRHEDPDLEMPKNGPKLLPSVIADFERWAELGAPDPRDHPATDDEVAADTDWPSIRERRENWWSFQPIERAPLPQSSLGADNRIDARIHAKLEEAGLQPAPEAEPEILARRLAYTLTGLPPEADTIERFLENPSDREYARLVDTYLNSSHFGERWARHWMDWVRYAESHGSEGDPRIPYAYRYRDYLIRALNADVPMDQLIRESVAGDLVPQPRRHPETGLNESAIGPAQLRMVLHGFAPTDALDEFVRFTDDQIDTVSKAYLGLTVACARCHNHKFDPISQADYYAWFGVFGSLRPGIQHVNPPGPTDSKRAALERLKSDIQAELANLWNEDVENLPERFEDKIAETYPELEKLSESHWLHGWRILKENGSDAFQEFLEKAANASEPESVVDWEAEAPNSPWYGFGPEVESPAPAGEFAIALEGAAAITGIYPSGIYSHRLSARDPGAAVSPRFDLDQEYDVWFRVTGDQGAVARYVVQNYPRNGTVYPVANINGGDWRWIRYSLDYWTGDRIHIEVSAAGDQPVLAKPNAQRSWFGLDRALIVPSGAPFPESAKQPLHRWIADYNQSNPIQTQEAFANAIGALARQAVGAWTGGSISDPEAELIDHLLKANLLRNSQDGAPELGALIEEYRNVEATLPDPIRVPGVWETTGFDQPIFERGDHKRPGTPEPRRFLEAIDETPYEVPNSGRLQLANDLVSPENPLTARVMANRVWSYLFGAGLVSTMDNFGRLGDTPSHPDLLDDLALELRNNDWSLKSLIRKIVHSHTWKRSSVASEKAQAVDPTNRLLSHQNLRRLNAEAIRDTLLKVSGRLEESRLYGESVSGQQPRRSVYVQVIRNQLDPFLETFDAPAPVATKGRRDNANTPAQALTMMNSPFVIENAEAWGAKARELADRETTATAIRSMFVDALGRDPDSEEMSGAQGYLEASRKRTASVRERKKELQNALKELTAERDQLYETATRRAEADPSTPKTAPEGPEPFAEWTFDDDSHDSMGALHAEPQGDAKLENGQLVLSASNAYALSKPLTKSIREKTLEVWLQLDSLDQTGGGAIGIQTLNGSVFDSIVFGEQEPRHWLAGSDFFNRTQSFRGPKEDSADQMETHFAISYAANGEIRAYRNGAPYGEPYQVDNLATFEAGKAQAIFGVRHSPPADNKRLFGRISRARLYDRALSKEEIADSFASGSDQWTLRERLATLDPNERATWDRINRAVESTQTKLDTLDAQPGLSSEWAELAHALFNLKEFLYLQ